MQYSLERPSPLLQCFSQRWFQVGLQFQPIRNQRVEFQRWHIKYKRFCLLQCLEQYSHTLVRNIKKREGEWWGSREIKSTEPKIPQTSERVPTSPHFMSFREQNFISKALGNSEHCPIASLPSLLIRSFKETQVPWILIYLVWLHFRKFVVTQNCVSDGKWYPFRNTKHYGHVWFRETWTPEKHSPLTFLDLKRASPWQSHLMGVPSSWQWLSSTLAFIGWWVLCLKEGMWASIYSERTHGSHSPTLGSLKTVKSGVEKTSCLFPPLTVAFSFAWLSFSLYWEVCIISEARLSSHPLLALRVTRC